MTYFGLALGLRREVIGAEPYGALLDLMACRAIAGGTPPRTSKKQTELWPDWS